MYRPAFPYVAGVILRNFFNCTKSIQWRTEGFWRPGRRWELAPLTPGVPRVKLASAESDLRFYWGVWGGAPAENAFWNIWV